MEGDNGQGSSSNNPKRKTPEGDLGSPSQSHESITSNTNLDSAIPGVDAMAATSTLPGATEDISERNTRQRTTSSLLLSDLVDNPIGQTGSIDISHLDDLTSEIEEEYNYSAELDDSDYFSGDLFADYIDGLSSEETDDVIEEDLRLSKEEIMYKLKSRKYSGSTGPHVDADICCICQEEYEDDDNMGEVDCGHKYHFACIEHWLLMENICPLCKKIALAP